MSQQVLAALADPTRHAILAELATGGSATATELARRLPLSRQGIVKQLGILAAADLVRAIPGDGRRVRYRLDPAAVRRAERYLGDLAREWESPLARLRDDLHRELDAGD